MEGRPAAQKDVHDNTRTPDVAHGVVPAIKDLWGHVKRRAKLGFQKLAWRARACKTKVDQFQHVAFNRVLREKEVILGLEVTVGDVPSMQVVDAEQNLFHHDSRLFLREVMLRRNAVEELPTTAQLHGEVHMAALLKCLEQLNDVWMVRFFHEGDLLAQKLIFLLRSPRNRFDGAHAARRLVPAEANRTECTLAENVLVQSVNIMDVASVFQDEVRMTRAVSTPN
mmetsp:Transcript_14488/g.36677  ORF Transcript_14488/g.36677 Transcript_14488/m.36677 type:complete len:225 (+) Transcript_14488:1263-1937(+)